MFISLHVKTLPTNIRPLGFKTLTANPPPAQHCTSGMLEVFSAATDNIGEDKEEFSKGNKSILFLAKCWNIGEQTRWEEDREREIERERQMI